MKRNIFFLIVLLTILNGKILYAKEETTTYNHSEYNLSLTINHDAPCEIYGIELMKGKEVSFTIQSNSIFRMYKGCAFIVEAASGERYATVEWLNEDASKDVGNLFRLKKKKKNK